MHRTVAIGDAIGNDIFGTYRLLERTTLAPTIVCEFPHSDLTGKFTVSTDLDPHHVNDSFDLLIYHHSVEWQDGEKILNAFDGQKIVKYHCVTPPHFFAKYSSRDEQTCRKGIEQTERIAQTVEIDLWLPDSRHNALELQAVGVETHKITVLPPFNRTGMLLKESNKFLRCPSPHVVEVLFIGRRAPSKGHRHLLMAISGYKQLFSENVKLTVVGAVDEQTRDYSTELTEMAVDLGVEANVEWLSHVSNSKVDELLCGSNIYVNASEHEGFCVPIIEAQAVGLPVISVDCAAARETLGPNQAVIPLPRSHTDYDVMAGLIHEVATNATFRRGLVEYGFQNVYRRFSDDAIENTLVEAILRVTGKFN